MSRFRARSGSAPKRGRTARLRALPLVDAPGHVTLLVLLGIPLLAVFTFVMVSQLQMEVQEEEGSATEAAWCEAAQQQGCLGADGISSLEDLAKQLAALARGNPRIIEFWLLRPDRGLVRHYLRRGQNTLGEGCTTIPSSPYSPSWCIFAEARRG